MAMFKKWQKQAAALLIGSTLLGTSLIPLSGFAGTTAAKTTTTKPAVVAQTKPAATATTAAKPKYIFYFIGDGMGMAQINSAQIYLNANGSKTGAMDKLSFTSFPAQGMKTTYAADSFIPDSASAGTAMATGVKTSDGVIGMDVTKTKSLRSVADMAKDAGMKVGIVTSVSIDHATPAVFYANSPSRSNYYDIGVQLTQSNFDYFGGGGFVQPKGAKGDQADLYDLAKTAGYTVANTTADIKSLKPGKKVLAVNETLDSSKALPYEINRASNDLSLADYTKKGIELLDNSKGFFMMVEGGKIDWACHANDAATSIQDTLAFSASVNEAYQFYLKHPTETLIIVTGDHETGGMTIGYAGTKYETFYNELSTQKVSYDAFDTQFAAYKKTVTAGTAKFADVMPLVNKYYGLYQLSAEETKELTAKAKEGDKAASKKLNAALDAREMTQLENAFKLALMEKKERPSDTENYLLYGGYEPLSMALNHIINSTAGIAFTTYSHTGTAVPFYAVGVGNEQFKGYYDDTDTFKKLVSIMGVK